MQERVGRWAKSNTRWWRELPSRLLFGCRRPDGSYYWTRGEYFRWVWKAFVRKWLLAPLRCKLGWHRIGPKSDSGMAVCPECGGEPDGCMDVWCLDCDRALRVPIDEVIDEPKKRMVLDIARTAKRP